MASRAPTLAKPKAKPKVTTKKIVAKSASPQSTVALKPVTKTSKAATKVASAKTPAKASVTKSTKSSTDKIAAKITTKHAAHKTIAKPKAVASDTADVSGTASFEAPAPKPRRRTKGEIRTRIYWAVFNQSLRRVAVFEFDQREEAEKTRCETGSVHRRTSLPAEDQSPRPAVIGAF